MSAITQNKRLVVPKKPQGPVMRPVPVVRPVPMPLYRGVLSRAAAARKGKTNAEKKVLLNTTYMS